MASITVEPVSRRRSTAQTVAGLPTELANAHSGFGRYLLHEMARPRTTVRAYLADVASLLDQLARRGSDTLVGLDITVLRGWLAWLRTLGAAPSSLARRAAAARVFCAWAHRNGLLANDPGRKLVSPKNQRPLPHILRPEQVRLLIEAVAGTEPLDLRDRLVLELLYATAARVSELCGLDLDHVDDSRRAVTVVGKGNKQRVVPYGIPAQRSLDRYLADARPRLATPQSPPALLLGTRGGRLNPTIVRRIVRARLQVLEGAIGVGPHGMRHSAATHLLEAGAGLRIVQELLGHESVGSTQTYTQVAPEHLRATYRQAHPRA